MQPGDTIKPSVSGSSEEPKSFYRPSTQGASVKSPRSSARREALTWTASEFIDHEKPGGWYALLAAAAVVITVLVYLLTGDVVTTVVIAIAAVLFGVVAARRPRTLSYTIEDRGIVIGDKHYSYSEFKTFSLITDSSLHSVQLLPLKRFMPPISIYFPPDQEDKVLDTLGQYLPYEERGHDAFDRMMSRIRF